MPPVARPARSRRARGSLTREEIVDAALAIVDAEGLDELSMPRLARQLGCGVMTIYGHLADKAELLDLVVARVLQDVRTPAAARQPWDLWADEWLGSLRSALLDHPQVAQLLAQSELKKSPVILKQLEDALKVFAHAGFPPPDATRAVWSLIIFVLGYVQWEVPRTHARPREDYVREWRVLVAGAPEDHTALRDALPTLETVADEEQYRFALEVLIAGLHHRLSPSRLAS